MKKLKDIPDKSQDETEMRQWLGKNIEASGIKGKCEGINWMTGRVLIIQEGETRGQWIQAENVAKIKRAYNKKEKL